MKSGVGQIVGKTISGVVVARNTRSPNEQVFLIFSDGTHFEFYGDRFSCTGGVDQGGIEETIHYATIDMGGIVTQVHPENEVTERWQSGSMPT